MAERRGGAAAAGQASPAGAGISAVCLAGVPCRAPNGPSALLDALDGLHGTGGANGAGTEGGRERQVATAHVSEVMRRLNRGEAPDAAMRGAVYAGWVRIADPQNPAGRMTGTASSATTRAATEGAARWPRLALIAAEHELLVKSSGDTSAAGATQGSWPASPTPWAPAGQPRAAYRGGSISEMSPWAGLPSWDEALQLAEEPEADWLAGRSWKRARSRRCTPTRRTASPCLADPGQDVALTGGGSARRGRPGPVLSLDSRSPD